jgi:hypothetical protein
VITPGLLRRAVWRGMQWRLLAIWWVAILVPSLVASLPISIFFSRNLERWPGAKDAIARLDGQTLNELFRQLGERGSAESMGAGFAAALITLFFAAPVAAGAAVTAASSDEPKRMHELLAGAGALYGRMLRTFLCGLLPFAIAGAATGAAFSAADHFNELATREMAAVRNLAVAAVPSLALIFIAHIVADTARAQFAADPHRRSALIALWSALRLVIRRPVRALTIGASGTLLAGLAAVVFIGLRLRIEQKSAVPIALAWLLGQLATVAVGWGRNARIIGLAELARADAESRRRPAIPPPAPVPAQGLSADLGSAT